MRGKRQSLEDVEGSLIRRNSASRKPNDWTIHIPATARKMIDVIRSVLQQRKWISSKRAGEEGIFLGRGCHCQKINRANNQNAVQRAMTTITNKNKLETPMREPP